MFNRGDSVNIQCRVTCQCGGTNAEWSERSNLPQGLSASLSFTKRVDRLQSSSAQPQHSGFYTCRVFNPQDSSQEINEQIEIIVN